MDANDVLNNLCCGDNHRVWSAGWWIIRATAAELDKLPLASLNTIRVAVMALPVPEGPAVADSREIPRLAFEILACRAAQRCRCSLYGAAQRFLPEEEQARGYVVVERKDDIPWEPEFYCRCRQCGTRYFVHESHSYHYPWAEWSVVA